MLRILHTSDWHIGRSLGAFKRYEEHASFFTWLSELIRDKQIDVLVVAGDVFDSSTPGNRAQEIYFRFLKQASDQGCRHVVVVAGNHDSPTLLDAPRVLLKSMNIHIVGASAPHPADSVIILNDHAGLPELIVCAVPFLRDRDVRTSEAGESPEERERKLVEGIRGHYAAAGRQAEALRDSQPRPVPVLATGHLFAAGARAGEDEGARELYIGSLGRIPGDIFPSICDYVALGHLHSPQKVLGQEHVRYSGAPLHFNFAETYSRRCVVYAELGGSRRVIEELAVPEFQQLERIRGSWEEISERLQQLKAENSRAWLELVCTDPGSIELGYLLNQALEGTEMKAVKASQRPDGQPGGARPSMGANLEDLQPAEVFERLLTARNVDESKREELMYTFKEVLGMVLNSDDYAE